MSYGLKIFRPNGEICIDGDFLSYEILATGYAPYNTFINLPTTPTAPLIFTRPPAYGRKFLWIPKFDYSPGPSYTSYRLPEGKYVLAVPANGSSGENSGIRVYNSSGQVSFDSGKKYVNIDSIVFKTPNTRAEATTWSQTITYNPAPIGERYFLLNPISNIEINWGFTDIPCDGCPGIDYMEEIDLQGTFNSETSVTYNYSIGYSPGWNSYMAGSGQRMNNPGIPLVSAYINL